MQKRKPPVRRNNRQTGGMRWGKSLLLGELVLAGAAQGAHPVGGQVLPLGAGGDAIIRIAQSLVVHIAADIADVLHSLLSFLFTTCIGRSILCSDISIADFSEKICRIYHTLKIKLTATLPSWPRMPMQRFLNRQISGPWREKSHDGPYNLHFPG